MAFTGVGVKYSIGNAKNIHWYKIKLHNDLHSLANWGYLQNKKHTIPIA